MKYLIALSVIFGNAALIWCGIHFGSKWVDKMLHYSPVDPTKPVVRRQHGDTQ